MRRDETRALAGGGQRRLFSIICISRVVLFLSLSPFLSHRAGSKCVVGINIRGKAVPGADLPVYWPLSSPEGWQRLNHEREHDEQLIVDVGDSFALVEQGG